MDPNKTTPGRKQRAARGYIPFNDDPRNIGTLTGKTMPQNVRVDPSTEFENVSEFFQSPPNTIYGASSRRTTTTYAAGGSPNSVGGPSRRSAAGLSGRSLAALSGDGDEDEDDHERSVRRSGVGGMMSDFGVEHDEDDVDVFGGGEESMQIDSPSISRKSASSRRQQTRPLPSVSPRVPSRLSRAMIPSRDREDEFEDVSAAHVSPDASARTKKAGKSMRQAVGSERGGHDDAADDDNDDDEGDEFGDALAEQEDATGGAGDTTVEQPRRADAGQRKSAQARSARQGTGVDAGNDTVDMHDDSAHDLGQGDNTINDDDGGMYMMDDNGGGDFSADGIDLGNDDVDPMVDEALDDGPARGQSGDVATADQDDEDEDDQAPRPAGKKKANAKGKALAKEKSKAQGVGGRANVHSEDEQDENEGDGEARRPAKKFRRGTFIDPNASIHVPVIESNTRLRGARERHVPLKFWQNERPVLKHDGESVVVTEWITKPEIPAEPYAAKRKRAAAAAAAARARGRSSSAAVGKRSGSAAVDEDDVKGWDDKTEPSGWVLDYADGTEKMRRVACPEKDFAAKSLNSASFKYQKVFGEDEFFAAGVLYIDVDGEKTPKDSKDNVYCFFVEQGCVEVTIHRTRFLMSERGMFLVPRGNLYSFKNKCRKQVKLFFAQGRKNKLENMEEQPIVDGPHSAELQSAETLPEEEDTEQEDETETDDTPVKAKRGRGRPSNASLLKTAVSNAGKKPAARRR